MRTIVQHVWLLPATSQAKTNDLPGEYSDVTIEELRALVASDHEKSRT